MATGAMKTEQAFHEEKKSGRKTNFLSRCLFFFSLFRLFPDTSWSLNSFRAKDFPIERAVYDRIQRAEVDRRIQGKTSSFCLHLRGRLGQSLKVAEEGGRETA